MTDYEKEMLSRVNAKILADKIFEAEKTQDYESMKAAVPTIRHTPKGGMARSTYKQVRKQVTCHFIIGAGVKMGCAQGVGNYVVHLEQAPRMRDIAFLACKGVVPFRALKGHVRIYCWDGLENGVVRWLGLGLGSSIRGPRRESEAIEHCSRTKRLVDRLWCTSQRCTARD